MSTGDYRPSTIEQRPSTTRLWVCSPSVIPSGGLFNTERSISELLDHLCEHYALFRSEAVNPQDRKDLYPVYALEKPLSLDHPVLTAISMLPRNDNRTNEFIRSAIKAGKTFADRFSESLRIIGTIASPEDTIQALMSRIQPSHQTLFSDSTTFLVIGIPVVTIQQGFRLPMSLLSAFLKDKFSYKKPCQRPQQAKFKQDAVAFYACAKIGDKSVLFDAATGLYLPCDLLVAGHIFKHEWRPFWKSFWGDSTERSWDPRNVLILNYAVENAFDQGKIAVYEEDSDLKWHILDRTILKVKISEWMGTEANRLLARSVLPDTTFSDLEGTQVQFVGTGRPFRRCLCFHAQVSLVHAIEEHWDGADVWNVSEYYTDDDLDLDVAHFLTQVSTVTASSRASIESFAANTSNDAIFVRAHQMMRRRRLPFSST